MEKKSKIYLLVHPIFIFSLVILIINDHYLKSNYPSYLTGKLSDFFGLFVFVVFITSILSIWNSKNKVVFLVHIITFSLFTFVKIYPIKYLFPSDILKFYPHIINDRTDLIALFILPFSYHFITKWKYKDFIETKKLSLIVIIPISLFSILATSLPVYNYIIKLENENEIILNNDIDDKNFEDYLLNKGFTLIEKNQSNLKTQYLFHSSKSIAIDSTYFTDNFSKKNIMEAEYKLFKKDSLLQIEQIIAYSFSDSLEQGKVEYIMLNNFFEEIDSLIKK